MTTGSGGATRPRALGLVTVAGAGLVLGVSVAGADDPADRFSTNGAALTYGSLLDPASPDHEPDLIRVLATNGREGYVYQSDLYPPELEPADPQEAGELQDARDRKAASAFVDALTDELGTSLGGPPDDAVEADLRALGAADDAAAQTAAIDEALQAAAEAVQREVPAYEADGTTRVGVFVSG